jgi:lipopolysaccharide transport system permease protein
MTEAVAPAPPRWSRVLEARKSWLDLRLRELWRYRDLIALFVHRDFVAQYKQTVLGPLWLVVQPLFTTVVFVVIFQKIAKIPTDGIPSILFYMCGVTAWNYFADCLTKTSNTFGANNQIFEKVYFPRLTVPISIVITNLATFTIQFALFLVFCAFFFLKGAPVHPSWHILVLPVLLLQMAALGLGAGCLVSALTTRYRDLAMLVSFGVQLWMYASCIAYPLSAVPAEARWLFALNPMVPIVESLRFAFLGTGIIEGWQLAVGAAESALILFAGLVIFCRVEKKFTDTI